MQRRELIKNLFLGAVAGTAVVTAPGCLTDTESPVLDGIDTDTGEQYGRTPVELERDAWVRAEEFLTEGELSTVATLVDLILPATAEVGGALEAGVPAFIEFIVKDIPSHQLPLRGGLMWLHSHAMDRFGKSFEAISDAERRAILDDIAYPDEKGERPELAPGIKFFDRLRNLTLTGYYTSRIGVADLGYSGNRPNVWDGVPQSVLDKHGLAYEPEWLAKCVDQERRDQLAAWDDAGRLLT